jgi:hypothetical protein
LATFSTTCYDEGFPSLIKSETGADRQYHHLDSATMAHAVAAVKSALTDTKKIRDLARDTVDPAGGMTTDRGTAVLDTDTW